LIALVAAAQVAAAAPPGAPVVGVAPPAAAPPVGVAPPAAAPPGGVAPPAAASAVTGAPPAAAARATDVEIAIAAPAPEAATAVRVDLEDLLARRGLAARYRRLAAIDRDEVLRPASEAPCALACIWVDLGVSKPARAFVYISATASEQVVIRSLPLPAGVDEVAREEVAHIVATSVEALQAGRPLPIAASPSDAALAKTVRAPAPPAPSQRTLWLAGVGGGVAHEGASQLALPVASLSLLAGSQGRALAPAVWVALGLFSSETAGDPVALRFHGGEVAALAAVGTRASDEGRPRRVVARLGLGPGLELREATPLAANGATGVAVDGARWDASVLVRAAARLEVRLSDAVGIFFAAACDARVVSRRYTIERDGMTEPLFQPDVLRPSIVVGLDARFSAEAAP
jgi:hypothetical protein